MEVTSRWWATAGAGLVLVALGIVAERPIFLVAAAGIGAWLVGVAGATSRAFTRLADRLAVEYTTATADTFVDTDVAVTLAVSRPAMATVPLSVHVEVPVGAESEEGEKTVTLGSGVDERATEFDVSFPVAGRFTFASPTVVMADPTGLYRARVARGPTPSVTAGPKPLDIHVGQGGEAVQNAYGEHQAERSGPGVTTQEIRQYVPGDSVRRIDWKATARLADVYIRETQGETDRRTALIVDHRDRMGAGSAGETMLDYAREVAIGIVRTAADQKDPIGVETVGDDGITATVRSSTSVQSYARAESVLYELTPTAASATSRTSSASRARELAERIEGGDDAFARVLGTYVDDPIRYVTRLRDDPLVGSVRRIRNQGQTGGLVVIMTSDDEPTRLREAVKIAVAGGGRAVVFLSPRCLFEPTDVTALNDVYDRYLAFERLRRELDAHPRATVLAIAPETRLDAVLAHRREVLTSAR
jgi:uncharacterized protein (DUF58 family)